MLFIPPFTMSIQSTKHALWTAYRCADPIDPTDDTLGIPMIPRDQPEFFRIQQLREEDMVKGYLLWTRFHPLPREDPLHKFYKEMNRLLKDMYTREQQFNPWIIARLLNVYNEVSSTKNWEHYKKGNQNVWDSQLFCRGRSYSDLRTLMRNTPYHAATNLIDMCTGNKNSGSANLNVMLPGEIKINGREKLLKECHDFITIAENHSNKWGIDITLDMATVFKIIRQLRNKKNRGPVRNNQSWWKGTIDHKKLRLMECQFIQLSLLMDLFQEYWYGDMGGKWAQTLKESIALERKRYEFLKRELGEALGEAIYPIVP